MSQGREATTADVNVSEGQAHGMRQPGQQNEDRKEQSPDHSLGKYHASGTNRKQAHSGRSQLSAATSELTEAPVLAWALEGPSGPHQARTESLTCYTALHSSHKTLTRLTPADRGVSSPVSEALAAASPPSGSVTAPHRGQGQPLVTTLSQAPTSVATKYLERSQGQHPETT